MIGRAFADVPRPGERPLQITPHACPECDEVAENLAKHTVKSLPPNLIDHHSTALPLLSPEAFHYWLPAWMIRALDDPDGDVIELTIFQLAGPRQLRQGS